MDFYVMAYKAPFSFEKQKTILTAQDGPILPTGVANHNGFISFSRLAKSALL